MTAAERPDVAVLDYALPDGTALELLAPLRELDPLMSLVVLTGHGTIDLAVRAVKEGAEHFLTKPVELEALAVMLERLIENRRNKQKQIASVSRTARESLDPFIGTSAAIRDLSREAARLAEADSPVLVLGETGSGKGVLAGWLHRQSRRANEPFVDLNCASLSREFLESELFGHERGAFTGATSSKPGLLEIAEHGTLFLDEIGDLESEVQPKLLKALEDKRFRRLGAVRDRHADVRLLAATHQNLERLVEEKRFRADLYYRISIVPIVVPPLRQRQEDILVIARELLRTLSRDRRVLQLTPSAQHALCVYAWPGNVRELRNVLERAVLLADGDRIDVPNLRFGSPGVSVTPPDGADLTLVEHERRHIVSVLQSEGGHVERAAQRLGIPRSSLYAKLKRHGLETSRS